MVLSREARLVAGVSLLTIPSVMYGGITLVGILTRGAAGYAPANLGLDHVQWALFRAGHAHAGVWLVLALLLQILLDSATLSPAVKWVARISAPIAAAGISAGFFGLAFLPTFRWVLYFGASSLLTSVLLTGVGLIRRPRAGLDRSSDATHSTWSSDAGQGTPLSLVPWRRSWHTAQWPLPVSPMYTRSVQQRR